MTPIVLHHGFMARGDLRIGPWRMSYFRRIERAIVNRGYPVIVTNVHPTAGIAHRARQLKEAILAQKLDEPMVIIAHSMGGLDARYMLTHLGMAQHVKALVTISAPHRGSPYADWCLKHLGQRLGGLRLMKLLRLNVQAVADLTLANCREFNQTTPDMPEVKYFSVSSQSALKRTPAFGRHAHRVIEAAQGPNDGLVSVSSAQWGEHLATWPADHWLTIDSPVIPRPWESTRIVGYWMEIIDRLEQEGLLDAAERPGS
jgi:triacylglycerol lipase